MAIAAPAALPHDELRRRIEFVFLYQGVQPSADDADSFLGTGETAVPHRHTAASLSAIPPVIITIRAVLRSRYALAPVSFFLGDTDEERRRRFFVRCDIRRHRFDRIACHHFAHAALEHYLPIRLRRRRDRERARAPAGAVEQPRDDHSERQDDAEKDVVRQRHSRQIDWLFFRLVLLVFGSLLVRHNLKKRLIKSKNGYPFEHPLLQFYIHYSTSRPKNQPRLSREAGRTPLFFHSKPRSDEKPIIRNEEQRDVGDEDDRVAPRDAIDKIG